MKLPVPVARVKYLHARRGKRGVEFALQDLLHAGAHEVHDFLGRVDDAVRVGLFDGKALEETLVDGIKEMLFLRPAVQRLGCSFNGHVEAIQRFFKVVAIEGAAGQGANDLFDFGGNDVAVGEIGVVEDGAEQALGQQVLYQHLIHGFAANLGVERGAAKFKKSGKGTDELRVFGVFLVDARPEDLAQGRGCAG